MTIGVVVENLDDIGMEDFGEGEVGSHMESFEGLMPPVPARQLRTPPMIEAAKKAMREHGCVIVEDGEHCVGEPDPDLRKQEGLRLFL